MSATTDGRTDTTVDGTTAAGPRLRPVLQGLPGYVPGRAVIAPADRPAWKLSSNENPYPPLPGVLEVVRDVAAGVNRYPDAGAAVLVAAIADRFGVAPENVTTGPGSVGVLQQVLSAVAGPGDEVVHAWRSFEAYPILVQLAGATGVPVPLEADERHDLDAMAGAITSRTRLVLLCSPNNPTGTALRAEELDRFLDRVPSDVLVVLDEAYREFVRDPQVPDGVELWHRRPNLAVLRTFSKAYGLAGLRVGFGIAHPEVAAALRQTALPFGVSAVAQAAAVASLDQQDALLERVDALVVERRRVADALRAQGWTVADTEANFVWLRLGARTAEVTDRCAAAGVAVRPFGAEGIRVTIGEAAGNDTFLEVAAAAAAAR